MCRVIPIAPAILIALSFGLVGCAQERTDVGVFDGQHGPGGGNGGQSGGGDDGGDDGSGDGGGDGGDQVKFDTPVPEGDPGGGDGGGCGGGDLLFSYIWISNAGRSTLTKLNTVTLVEEGRYLTRAGGTGNPSRTSVNLSGDMAVANRNGGITKFYARAENCPETNGIPGIQTSTGKEDVLPWDEEECRAWHTPIDTTSNRPIAWTAGTFHAGTCTWTNQKVWTSAARLEEPGSLQVLRLDGITGEIEEVVHAPDIEIGDYGAYGGAVDGEDNFWFTTTGVRVQNTLSRVRYDDLTLETWPVPDGVLAYGMTFDSEGHAWVAGYYGGVARFDAETEQWDVVDGVEGLGIQADGEGRAWVGSRGTLGSGTFAIDVETLEVLDFIPIDADITKGVSIDFHGYVWIVDMARSAHRVDPDTNEIISYDGLNAPYTYSDMTGWGLANVAGVPQG